jgi:chromate transporter
MTNDIARYDPAEQQPPVIGLFALFLKFLRFGCLAFGGPVAQIAMIRQTLVEEEKWISPARFNRLLAVMQILPGPEAHELCVHLGITARGRIGGLLAGLGFMLPGLILMLAAGWAYQTFVMGRVGLGGILLGIQIAVLAIILRAVQRIGTHMLEDRLLRALALASLAATLGGVPFWIPLGAAGLIYAFHQRLWVIAAIVAVAAASVWLTVRPAADMAVSIQANSSVTALALFVAGLKGGLLTFGGAYTAIPYVRHDTVANGWISDATFLDGVALAGILPAPLVIFATFTGYIAGGWSGALAITAGMFLPAFAFSMIFYERLEAVVENPALHGFLGGVAAAVVGVIVATLSQLAMSVGERVTGYAAAIAIFLLCVAAVWKIKGKWVMPSLVLAAGLAGWLLNP